MKTIKYNLKTRINTGTKESPVWEDREGPECSMPYSEANLAIAQAEAFGEVNIEDDGQTEPEAQPSQEEITLDLLADHEYRLCMLELGGDVL